jgi:exonuclease SbcC
MITKLTLKNFKKHEDLTVQFQDGLVALKGANEAGKSTLYHAVVYAMFGARALPMTLAETVTYEKPEGSLKVELTFTFEQVSYTIVRSKSGAVITNGTETANGQAEVTKYVERLFGVNADAATKLMVASQGGLRGALETGEAVPLIEKLANIDLLDMLISKIQDQLPSGNTKQITDTLTPLYDLKKPVLDTEDLEPTVAFTKAALQLAKTELETLEENDTIDEQAQRAIIADVVKAEQRWEQITIEMDQLMDRLVEPTPPTVDIEGAKRGLEAMREHTIKEKAFKVFWESTSVTTQVDDFDKEWKANEAAIGFMTDAIVHYKLAAATAKALIITETACGLCGKDLSDVPEVVTKNAANAIKIKEAEDQVASITVDLEVKKARRVFLTNLQKLNTQLEAVHRATEKFTKRGDQRYPRMLTWVGEVPKQVEVWPDYVAEIREGERLQREYDKAKGVYAELADRQGKLLTETKGLVVDTPAKILAQGLLAQKEATRLAIKLKQQEVNTALGAYKDAANALEQAQQKHDTELGYYLASMESKAKLEESLKEMQKNNALIKKLREARPIVAGRLWAIVLASVSTYFSQIRGEPSIVTRSSNSFAVGGKPVGGLSGSTLDALGLAIRMALSKTFLPSIDYLLLDEPAAGMDEERETAMLGLLAATGYDQVVVVTHSNLADAFATQVIQL